MSNLVFYRKYRPTSFSEIIGQEHIVQILTNSLKSGKISHAYLFSGQRGTGKTTVARILAKALNCEDKNGGDPCNKCQSCKNINETKSLDIIEIDAASNRGIDEIRELREGARFAPSQSKYKVFVVDESHQLTKEASNALLKILEEPPSHVIFILATTEPHKMIKTILSRVQRFDFRRLRLDEIKKRLNLISEKEGLKVEGGALNFIAQNADGSFRDAENMLGQAASLGKKEITFQDVKDLFGGIEIELVKEFVDLVGKNDIPKAVVFINDMSDKGVDLAEFTKSLIKYFRKLMILKVDSGLARLVCEDLTEEQIKTLQAQKELFPSQNIQKALGLFIEAENEIKRAYLPQMPLEIAVVELCGNDGLV